jgi:hypothetical protein
MSEIILSISEVTGIAGSEPWPRSYGGYEIATSQQTIGLLIDEDQQCCENSGYFMSHEDLSEFVGAELVGVTLTDDALDEVEVWQHVGNEEYFEGGLMFVDLKTSRGVLQFVAYNAHNGYYGHTARVSCRQLEHEERL